MTPGTDYHRRCNGTGWHTALVAHDDGVTCWEEPDVVECGCDGGRVPTDDVLNAEYDPDDPADVAAYLQWAVRLIAGGAHIPPDLAAILADLETRCH